MSIHNNIISQAAHMLACYRKNCSQTTTTIGQLILPETLKLLPIYIASLIKSDVLIGSKISTKNKKYFSIIIEIFVAQTVTIDDRNWLIHRMMFMNTKNTLTYLYPRIYALVFCQYERKKLIPYFNYFHFSIH